MSRACLTIRDNRFRRRDVTLKNVLKKKISLLLLSYLYRRILNNSCVRKIKILRDWSCEPDDDDSGITYSKF